MPNRLPLPDELKMLLEKREGGDRRQTDAQVSGGERRSGQDRRSVGDASTETSLKRPGSSIAKLGIYRCELCLGVIRHTQAETPLPSCPQCGNHDQPCYVLIAAN